MSFDDHFIDILRAETPGAALCAHFNNAGAALMPAPVLAAIKTHLDLEATAGGYEAAERAADRIAAFYASVARLTGADPRQIAFASSATDAYNRALSSIPFAGGDVILTTRDDYVSNQIAFLQLERRFGVRLLRAPNAPSGAVDVEEMARMIDRHRPRLVSVTHVPTNSGLVQPVAQIGALCRERGVWYLVDACQSAGQMPLDVNRIQCDFLSATFRKFLRGPRGAGFLFVSDRALEEGLAPLFLDLHSAEWRTADRYEAVATARRFEQWERPYALVCGAQACVDYALNIGMEKIEARVRALARLCRERLAALPSVRVLDRGVDLCGIATIHAEGRPAAALKKALAGQGINTSVVDRASARLDFAEKGVEAALRISPHYYNTEEEIDRLAETLRTILAG